jgi:hypothetical protein
MALGFYNIFDYWLWSRPLSWRLRLPLFYWVSLREA